jgi:hypothetical protein
MKRMLVLVMLTLGLVGCKGFTGPFQSREQPPVDPLLPLPEQEARARARYSIPFDDPAITPNAYADFYGSTRSGGPGGIHIK